MKAVQVGAPDYPARIRRAQHLASAHPFAAEVLTLYQQLAAFQQNLHLRISRANHRSAASAVSALDRGAAPLSPSSAQCLPEALNLPILLPDFPELLALLQTAGPVPVKQAARQVSAQTATQWESLLQDFWRSHHQPEAGSDNHKNGDKPASEPLTEFILRAFLQPYSEFLAARAPTPQLTANSRVCPRCGSLPLLGALRPEADGGKQPWRQVRIRDE